MEPSENFRSPNDVSDSETNGFNDDIDRTGEDENLTKQAENNALKTLTEELNQVGDSLEEAFLLERKIFQKEGIEDTSSNAPPKIQKAEVVTMVMFVRDGVQRIVNDFVRSAESGHVDLDQGTRNIAEALRRCSLEEETKDTARENIADEIIERMNLYATKEQEVKDAAGENRDETTENIVDEITRRTNLEPTISPNTVINELLRWVVDGMLTENGAKRILADAVALITGEKSPNMKKLWEIMLEEHPKKSAIVKKMTQDMLEGKIEPIIQIQELPDLVDKEKLTKEEAAEIRLAAVSIIVEDMSRNDEELWKIEMKIERLLLWVDQGVLTKEEAECARAAGATVVVERMIQDAQEAKVLPREQIRKLNELLDQGILIEEEDAEVRAATVNLIVEEICQDDHELWLIIHWIKTFFIFQRDDGLFTEKEVEQVRAAVTVIIMKKMGLAAKESPREQIEMLPELVADQVLTKEEEEQARSLITDTIVDNLIEEMTLYDSPWIPLCGIPRLIDSGILPEGHAQRAVDAMIENYIVTTGKSPEEVSSEADESISNDFLRTLISNAISVIRKRIIIATYENRKLSQRFSEQRKF